jgi:tetratricopeptide (TPR) repeat protein
VRAQGGKLDEAEQLLRQAIAAKPDRTEPYLNLVQLLARQGKNAEALKLTTQASQKFPDDRSVAVVAAVAYDTSGDLQLAKAGYEKILAKWPDDAVAANNLAALIADVWPTDQDLLDRARQISERFGGSDNPAMLDTLGWVLVRQGNYEDATVLLERAASKMPDNQQVQFHYAAALSAKGLKAKAKEVLNKALAGTPAFRGRDEAAQMAARLE